MKEREVRNAIRNTLSNEIEKDQVERETIRIFDIVKKQNEY